MFWEMPGPATAALALALRRAGGRCFRSGTQMFVHHLDGDLAMLAQQRRQRALARRPKSP